MNRNFFALDGVKEEDQSGAISMRHGPGAVKKRVPSFEAMTLCLLKLEPSLMIFSV